MQCMLKGMQRLVTGSVTQALVLELQSNAINHVENTEIHYNTWKDIKRYLTIYKIQVNFVQSKSAWNV